jgi:hypothetical protein
MIDFLKYHAGEEQILDELVKAFNPHTLGISGYNPNTGKKSWICLV